MRIFLKVKFFCLPCFFCFYFLLGAVAFGEIRIDGKIAGGRLEEKDIFIYSPATINQEIIIFHVDSDKYPRGIRVVNLQLTLASATAYVLAFSEWSGNPPLFQHNIEILSTLESEVYKEVKNEQIANREVDAGSYIALNLPVTEVGWVQAKIIFYRK